MGSVAWSLRLSAAALVVTGCAAAPPRPEVAARTARITPEAIGEHVLALTALGPRVESDEAVGRATLDLLARTLRAWGYEVREEPFLAPTFELVEWPAAPGDGSGPARPRFGFRRAGEREHRNLLAERRGAGGVGDMGGAGVAPAVVELGAHWDTVPGSLGADDNTSGVAALLEIARACADAPLQRTLRFCFYAHEERGLFGSAAHARALAASGEELIGALVMDMVGYASDAPGSQAAPVRIPLIAWMPTTADFIFIAGNWDSGGLADAFEEAAQRYVPGLDVWGVKRIAGWFPDAGRSDHFSYWEQGLPAILLSDTAEFRTPHYHRASDTPETLNLPFAADVARAACAWALEHALAPAGSAASAAAAAGVPP